MITDWKNTETRQEYMARKAYDQHHQREMARLARLWGSIAVLAMAALYFA